MSLSSRSIRRPVAVAMLFVAVLFLGLISFGRLPIDLLPEVAYPRLVVYTRYAGVGPAEIERYITEPIEQQVATVPGLQRIESASREGVSLVTLRFAWGSDMDFAALNVREKLDNLRESLPALAERPVVLRTDPGSDPIMAISVAGGGSLWSLKDLAESVLRRRLEQIEGVAQAAVTGGLEREIQVEVDASRLEAHGLVIGDVAGALDAANAPSAGGTVRRGDFRYALRTLGELESVEQIGEILVRPAPASGADSASLGVRLADVATITDGFRERESIARYNGREAVGLLIFKEAGANTVRVAEAVGDVLVELREEFPDIAVSVAMSQARFVSEAIDNVVAALLQGAALAFLVLFLFLRDWRYPVGIALAIPISVVATFALLDAAGISLNVMTLGGLALGVGMLVDNSIVVLENVFRHRELGSPAPVAAALGAEEVQGAITASTLTTIAVFGPIVYVEGVAGELFGALSLAVAFSLLASLVVALMLLPTLAARWQGAARGVRGVWGGGGRGGTAREARFIDRPLAAFDRAFARFSAFYERALHAALRHRARTLGAAAGLFVLALAVGSTLDRDVLPTVDQGELTLRLTLPRGAPLERTAQAAASLERLLLDDDAVEAVFTRVGRQAAIAGVTDEESGLHTGVLDVQLVDGAATADVVRRIRPRLAGLGVGTVAIETGTATALGRLLGGGEADLAVRVQGEDLDAALAYAGSVERRLEGVSAVTNVRLGTELGQPEVQIEIDRERAASYGIPPIEVARTIESYMQGQVATQFVDFDRRVPVVVRLPDATRHSLLALEQLRVRGVPLRELVVLRDAVGPTEIRRVDQTRQVAVYADVASGGVARATEAIESALRE
ncbi:MAG: efflux RND transporter permease subunit, partial [Longimicrobiales bacterium]